jgi:hypothetical protein
MRLCGREALSGVGVAAVGLLTLGVLGFGDEVPSQDRTDVQVTADASLSRTHEASRLLVDREDPSQAYLAEADMQSGDCRLYTSDDAGASWQPAEATVDSPLEQNDPDAPIEPAPEAAPHTDCSLGASGPQNIRTDLAQAPDGTLYYAFHAHDPDRAGARSVLLGRSSDGGASWETTVVAKAPDPGDDGPIQVNFEPHVAVDPADPSRVVVMWRRSFSAIGDGDAPPTRPYMAVSDDGGATFDEPFQMLDENIGFDGPRPVYVDGRLHAFYRVSAPPTGDDEQSQPTRLFAAVSDDGGQSWTSHEIAAQLGASEPVPAYDRDAETFYVVWHDNRHGDLDVFFSRSPNATEWSEPVRLNDDQIGNRVGQYYPQISLSPGGRVDVAWYDYRDDPNPPPPEPADGSPIGLFGNLGELQSVYLTSSTDGGRTWSDDVRVNDVLINRNVGTWNRQYFVVVPVSVASWEDHAVVSWSDTRNGTADTGAQDIYASVVSGDADDQTPSLVVGGVAVALLGAGAALLVAVMVMRRSRARVQQPAT